MDQEQIIKALSARSTLPPLTPKSVFDLTIRKAIEDNCPNRLIAAALHVLNDDLNSAHPHAQAFEGDPTADYWHAIVHRREGDYSNSRYWFGRVGSHPVVLALYGDPLGASRFVNECRIVNPSGVRALEEKQWSEMLRLLEYTIGG